MPRARVACVIAATAALSLLLPDLAGTPEPAAATPTIAVAVAVAHSGGTGERRRAALEDDPAALALTRLAPVLAVPGQPVTLSGRVDLDAAGIDAPGTGSADPPGATTPPVLPPGTVSPEPEPEPMARVEVRAASRAPSDRGEVTQWLAGSGASQGRVLGSEGIPPPAAGTGSSGAAGTVAFSVSLGDLSERMRGAYGVIPVSVEVWESGAGEPSSTLRTFIPYQRRKEYVPLETTLVLPFTVPRDLALVGEIGTERTSAWEELVGEDGSLRRRLDEGLDERLVWAVDPALLGPGPALVEEPDDGEDTDDTDDPGSDGTGSDGTGSDGTGTTSTGTDSTGTDSTDTDSTDTAGDDQSGQSGATPTSPATAGDGATSEEQPEDATPGTGEAEPTDGEADPQDDPAATEREVRSEFAAALTDASSGREILLLPRHDADIAALPAASAVGRTPDALRSLLDDSLDVAVEVDALTGAGAQVVPTLWPADGAWSATLDTAVDALASTTGPWSALASTTSATEPVNGPFPSASGSPVLPYDHHLSELAGSAHDDSAALEAALAMAADTLVTIQEQPGTTRHLIAVLAGDQGRDQGRDQGPLAATALADTLVQVPWIDLTGTGGPTHSGTLVEQAVPISSPPVLADARARDLAGTLARLPVAASVRAGTGADLATRGADTLAQLTSLRWRGAEEDWDGAYAPLGEDVAETFTGLSIPSRDISFLADTGLLRVTVENTLDTGIENATLDLSVAHPILRVESGPQPVEVGPDSRSTVSFEATALASGRVTVTATLRAPDGTVLGEPTTFSVRVSPTADWMYWVLGGLAGGVIVVGVARTVLRRRPRD